MDIDKKMMDAVYAINEFHTHTVIRYNISSHADSYTWMTQINNFQSVGSSVPVVSKWLWPGNRTFLEVASMVVTWWIVAFLRSV